MSDIDPAATAAPTETPGDAPAQQENAAARKAIARARRPTADAKRAPRNDRPAIWGPPPEPSTVLADASVSSEPAAAAPAPTKKKKPSGRKKTRAELLAIVNEYKKNGGKFDKGEEAALVTAANDPKVQDAYRLPPITQNPEAMAKLSSGVSRATMGLARIVARRRGAHWLLNKAEEADVIGDATADCLVALEEMFPNLVWLQTAVKLAPFAILSGALYEIVDSRLEIDARIEAGQQTKVLQLDSGKVA